MSVDVGMNSDGDLPLRPLYITGVELIQQRLTTRLRTFRGEWIEDFVQGLQFFDWIEFSPFPEVAVRDSVILECVDCPGIASATVQSSSYDTSTRTFTMTVSARLDPLLSEDTRATITIELPNRESARAVITPGGF